MSEQSEQSKQRKIAIVTGGGRDIDNTVNPKPLLHLEGAAVLIVSLVGVPLEPYLTRTLPPSPSVIARSQ